MGRAISLARPLGDARRGGYTLRVALRVEGGDTYPSAAILLELLLPNRVGGGGQFVLMPH